MIVVGINNTLPQQQHMASKIADNDFNVIEAIHYKYYLIHTQFEMLPEWSLFHQPMMSM